MIRFLKIHKILQVLLVFICVLLVFFLAGLVFLKTWTAFGGSASMDDKEDYARRAQNFKDDKFTNEQPFKIMTDNSNKDNNILSIKGVKPKDVIPTGSPKFNNINSEQLHVTWFGHDSILLQMNGANILIDPVFSKVISPVSFVGSKRFSDSCIELEDLPEIDVVILSHDHYDHMDYKTLKKIDSKVKKYIVPLGVENHLERWGFDSKKVKNMAWWEEINIDGLTIGCTPSHHYSGRSFTDQNKTLWASWVFKTNTMKIFESGDTGYGNHFQQIHDKYGDFDFVMLDCAQYNERWAHTHMFPEQSIKAAKILGAKIAMPVHWATFRLSKHPWDDPAERFTKAGEDNGILVVTPMISETMKFENVQNYTNRWWKNVN